MKKIICFLLLSAQIGNASPVQILRLSGEYRNESGCRVWGADCSTSGACSFEVYKNGGLFATLGRNGEIDRFVEDRLWASDKDTNTSAEIFVKEAVQDSIKLLYAWKFDLKIVTGGQSLECLDLEYVR